MDPHHLWMEQVVVEGDLCFFNDICLLLGLNSVVFPNLKGQERNTFGFHQSFQSRGFKP